MVIANDYIKEYMEETGMSSASSVYVKDLIIEPCILDKVIYEHLIPLSYDAPWVYSDMVEDIGYNMETEYSETYEEDYINERSAYIANKVYDITLDINRKEEGVEYLAIAKWLGSKIFITVHYHSE